jgi:streptogramin lyase
MRKSLLFIALAALAGPKAGIKTPGIQISFASLKPEAEFAAAGKPEWLFFAEQLFYPAKDSIQRIDPKKNEPGEPIAGLAKPCGGMAAGFDSYWAPLCGTSSLARIDKKTSKVTATIATGVAAASGIVAASDDSVWLLTDTKVTLARIDPEQNAVVGEIRLPVGCHSLIYGEKALWIACPEKNKVLRINAATNLVEKQIEIAGAPQGLAAGEGSIWALTRKDGKVHRIDPKTNKVSKVIDLEVPDAEGTIAFGSGWLWVSMTGFPLTRIDARQEQVAQQFAGAGGGILTVSPGAIWLTNGVSGGLARIDPKRVIVTLAE